jgi:hypothetical protein
LAGDSVTVVSGSIRTPDDPEALRVKLSIWDTEITMRVDGVELGNWEESEIGIRSIDSTSFEFVAEGDQLVFTPDDPSAFVATSLVKRRVPGGGRKKRRKAKEKTERAPAAAVVEDPLPAEVSRRGKRRSDEKSRAAKPSRRERKAAERERADSEAAEIDASGVVSPAPVRESTVRRGTVPTPIGRTTVGSVASADRDGVALEESPTIGIRTFREPKPEPVDPLPRVERGPSELMEPGLVDPLPRVEPGLVDLPAPAPRQTRFRLKYSAREGRTDEFPSSQPASEEPEEERSTQTNRLWIRALDLARKYDFLGLDRVPVNESLRGQEHQHTWDHRVAPSSGPGKYICTICGEIRR